MSRQFRYRVTALVVGGLIFGAPLLTNGTARAEQQVAEGGRQVVFEGGSVFDLDCSSRPDVETMVVPAESRVRVVNRTGYAARLLLSGTSKGVLADDAATEVMFRRGTTSVLLEPNCPLGNEIEPAIITASPSPTTNPDSTPAPAGGAPVPTTAPPAAGSPSTSGSGSSVGTVPGRVTPTSGTGGGRAPGTTRNPAAAVNRAPAAAQGGVASRAKTRTLPHTAGEGVPAFTGMPPGDKKALVPGVPSLDVAPATPDAAAAAPSPAAPEIAVAEPMATTRQLPDSAPLGMLALIAAVCVMGVGAAAIRAIVSQRANRAKVA